MADTLRRLTSTSAFSVLQDKLENFHHDYHVVSGEQNVDRCCELIELTAEVQGQLFVILNLTAAEGGQSAGLDPLRTRLLPWLGGCFSVGRPAAAGGSSLQLIQDSLDKDRRIRGLLVSHEGDLQKVEAQLCSTRLQLDSVRTQLIEAQNELDETRSKSSRCLFASEEEILRLKAELRSVREQENIPRRSLEDVEDYEGQSLLRDQVSHLTAEQDRLLTSPGPSPLPRLTRSSSPTRTEAWLTRSSSPTGTEAWLTRSSSPTGTEAWLTRSSSPTRTEARLTRSSSSTRTEARLTRSSSPTRTEARLTSSSRQARLVSRFSDLYAVERLEAQTLLRRYIADLEVVQKVLFIAVVESFKIAKLAYRHFKLRVKKTLSTSHFGPDSLEDAAVDYIVRNVDLYDVQASVNDVIDAMNVNPQVSFPPPVDFVLISSLIRETCRVSFAMQTLDPPLGLAFASDGEPYDDSKYRRSYGSSPSAPLVSHHVWPALAAGLSVVVKGEAVTGRLVLWRSRSVSPGRSRSLSPTPTLVFSSRRSLSPERLKASHL